MLLIESIRIWMNIDKWIDVYIWTRLYFADPVQVSPVHPAACFRLDYSVVYSAICDRLNDERTTLLLYLLLHQHQPFRNYVYTHADIQTMVCSIVFLRREKKKRKKKNHNSLKLGQNEKGEDIEYSFKKN